ncbi:unnamed protein product [Parascedosporium putredinis]|uniref:Vacuolar ATPase assembly integral membrane protein VMA21 n=1 Tax=Parascedosporium putredinis TaxID=1442378 RepID=A0A9P1H6J0_9PEZI|nr:unnamed protein product [Parascedosporium putredinis]CAI7997582.1 unnamed protein product [Parascedosporium putredinis]
MATRRTISSEKSISEKDDHIGGSSTGLESSTVGPAVPGHVIAKLLIFTLAMVVLPIGSYFASVNTLFKGNTTYAGGLAALMANVVLVGYVVVAMKEDQGDRKEPKAEGKKDR